MAALLNQESLKHDLGRFPSTFDFDLINLTKDRIKFMLRKLEDDRHSTGKLDTEEIQISNFLSYLYFLLDDNENAIQYVNESLQKDPDNITANANKARFLFESGEISEVEDIIRKLKELGRREDYKKRTCYAKADLAYAYARSGPWYHQKAVELYTQVVEAYPSEYAWKYGLGLTLLRRTHRLYSQADDRFNQGENEKTTARAAELFHDVGTKADDPNLRAKAFASLGKALYNISRTQYTNVPEKVMLLKPKECFEKALSLCQEEPSVLATCGKYARYRNELDLSEELLRKSLQIKPTCAGYHHLALTLKRRVENNQYRGQSVNRTGEGRIGQEYSQKPRDRSQGSCRVGQFGGQKKVGLSHSPWDDKSKYYQSDEKSLRSMMKSPLQVDVYPGNELLVEAITLIEKTEDLTEFGLVIQYDKGIIYRMLGQIEKAVKVFKQIVSKRKYHPTESPMTNVYEQLGLCLLELSKSEDISPDDQKKYKKDGQVHLLHAIQLQSEMVAKDPQFKKSWNSYSTLKQLFSDDREGKPRELAVLYMLMGDHRDSIDIYEELFKKGNDEMRQDDCVNLLKCYQKVEKFEECGFLLRSLECTTMFSDLPPPLIFDVYIDCAFHAYTTTNAQLAYQHFRRAFKVYGLFDKTTEGHAEVDECETTKDILILHTCPHDSECKHPRNLGTILEDVTGLRYTINSADVLLHQLELTAVVPFIQNIPCIIIMTHESAVSCHPLFVDQDIQRSSDQCGRKVLVVSDDKRNMPDIAKTKPFIRMPPLLEGAVDPNEKIPEEHQNWIKEFISLLKPK